LLLLVSWLRRTVLSADIQGWPYYLKECRRCIPISYQIQSLPCCSEGEDKLHATVDHQVPRVGVLVYLNSYFILGAICDKLSAPRPGRFTHGKQSWYPSYMRLCGPQSRSGRVRIRFPDRS